MVKSHVLVLAVLIAVAAMTGCPSPSGDGADVVPPPPVDETPPPQSSPKASWGLLVGTETEIVWVAQDGSEQHPVASHSPGTYEGRAQISPDGGKLAMFADDLSVEVVDIATGEVTTFAGPLEGEHWREYLAWSPDGQRLAWTEDGNLFVSAVDGETSQIVDTGDVTDLAWSPDSSQLAICRRDRAELGLGLFLIPADGGEMTQVAPASNDIVAASHPAWSPDGGTIAFCRSWETGTLCFAHTDGSDARLDLGPAAGRPLWLGDGTGVVYNAAVNEMETRGVYFCTPYGEPQAVAEGEFANFDMLPEGRMLLVRGAGDRMSDVSIIRGVPGDIAAEGQRQVPVAWGQCSWRPDGEAFAIWGTVGTGSTAQVFVGAMEGEMTRLEIDPLTVIGWARRDAESN